MPLIKDGKIVDDPWVEALPNAPLPQAESLLVTYEVWNEYREDLLATGAKLGIRLAADQPPHLIAGDVARFDLITLEFPTFRDGRAYSYARILRERYHYGKELRAVGNVLRDQLSFMRRCGFDAYDVADDRLAEAWSRALSEISHVYQPAADRRRTITALRHPRPQRAPSAPAQAPASEIVCSSWAY